MRPLIIAASKQDTPAALSVEQVASALGVMSLANMNWFLLPCSGRDGSGVPELFQRAVRKKEYYFGWLVLCFVCCVVPVVLLCALLRRCQFSLLVCRVTDCLSQRQYRAVDTDRALLVNATHAALASASFARPSRGTSVPFASAPSRAHDSVLGRSGRVATASQLNLSRRSAWGEAAFSSAPGSSSDGGGGGGFGGGTSQAAFAVGGRGGDARKPDGTRYW